MCGTLRRRMLLSVNGFTEPLRVPPVWRYCHVCVRTGQAQEAADTVPPVKGEASARLGAGGRPQAFPFTIRLKDRTAEESVIKPVRVKVDPGARFTGIAIVREDRQGGPRLIAGIELEHRGNAIRDNMTKRAGYRRRRRSANTRYRAPRFDNRRRPEGRFPPSLRHRIDTTVSWMRRLTRIAPVSGFSVESVKFDTQKMLDPEVSGKEYQQGELEGYEVREYLLEKWCRKCAYCNAGNVPLQVEHIVPRARGGSDRVSNLTLACERCNRAKRARPVKEFLADKPAASWTDTGARESSAVLRRCGQLDPQRTLWRDACVWLAGGDGERRTHQVQPHPPRAAEESCSMLCVSGQSLQQKF